VAAVYVAVRGPRRGDAIPTGEGTTGEGTTGDGTTGEDRTIALAGDLRT
jgi:hypothetical protein